MKKTQLYANTLTDKRVAVVGVGGVGGYLAGMLGQVCPHLTLAARGGRKESLQRNGLILHSDYKGELTAVPEQVVEIKDLKEQDFIFICVKNYSLEEVCRELAPTVTDETVIIPVMNGVNPGERVRSYLGRGTVVDSLIYIVAFANEDYSITQQGDFARLCIGIKDAAVPQEDEADVCQMKAARAQENGDTACLKNAAPQEKAAETAALLTAADIDCEVAADIEVEIWRKYILNCAYNVETAFYDNTIGQLRGDEKKAKEYEALVNEAYQVGLAKGVAIRQEHIDAIIHRFYYELADDATSSLQRDIRAGRRSEVDVFGGYIVREAERHGIPVPVSLKMYEKLREFQ